jgi:hypothetical protein
VPPDLQLVVVVGPVSEVAACGILEPPVHVLGDGHVFVVHDDTAAPVREGLGERIGYFLAGLP